MFNEVMKSVMKSVSPNSELLTNLSDENNFQKRKIKSSHEQEIKKLKNENPTLREKILTQLKITENLSGNNEGKMTNTPIKDKTKQNSDFNTLF